MELRGDLVSSMETGDDEENRNNLENRRNAEGTEMQILNPYGYEERTPIATELTEEPVVAEAEAPDQPASYISRSLAWRLYLSHLLSTWNSRSFEFGSVLFLAQIYPGTLLYLSIYAMCRSAAGIVLSTRIGKAIDHKARLNVVRSSIGRRFRTKNFMFSIMWAH